MRFRVAPLVALAVCTTAWSRAWHPGDVVQSVPATWTGPGQRVVVRVFSSSAGGWSAELLLQSGSRVLWEGPHVDTDPKRATDDAHRPPLVLRGNENNDDDVEVAGPLQAGDACVVVRDRVTAERFEASRADDTDVGQTCFRVLRWTGRGLTQVRDDALVEEPQGSKSGHFVWGGQVFRSTPDNPQPASRYVSRFLRIQAPGRCEVEITEAGSQTRSRAVALTDKAGLTLLSDSHALLTK